jgi:PAS domain-containing protein
MSPAGEILFWNHAAKTIFGYTESEAVGHSMFDLIVPADRVEETRNAVAGAIETGTSAHKSVRRTKEGSLIVVSKKDVTGLGKPARGHPHAGALSRAPRIGPGRDRRVVPGRPYTYGCTRTEIQQVSPSGAMRYGCDMVRHWNGKLLGRRSPSE